MPNPRPTPTTPFQESLYDALEPIADQDEANDWALLKYCGAIASMFDQIETYARDTEDDRPGWSQILNANIAPEEVLTWLHQITGTRPLPGLTVEAIRARILALNGQKRGTVGAMVDAAQQYLTGNKTVLIGERTSSPYHFSVQTLTSETPDSAAVLAALNEQKPAGLIMNYTVVTGATYLTIRSGYATYTAMTAGFLTYGGLRTNTPGT